MGVKSLAELCTAVCFKNIKEITDVGTAPYHLLRRIILKIDNPAHLLLLEENSPHLRTEDAECWIRLIDRDFPALVREHHFEPRNPESWHKVYAKYKKLNELQKAEAQAKLKSAFAGINAKKAANVADVVTFNKNRLPSLPRDGKMFPIKGAGGRRGGGNDTGELKFTTGTRTKTNTAQSIIRKVKREAKEIHNRNKLATPNGALTVRYGQIKKAPAAMVQEQVIKKQAAVKIYAPGMKRTADEESRYRDLEAREARLRKIKSGQKSSATIISDSELDDDDNEDEGGYESGGGYLDEDDLDDIFDASSKSTSRSGPSQSRPSASSAPRRTGVLAGNANRAPPQIRIESASSQQQSRPKSSVASSSKAALSPTLGPSSPPSRPLPTGSPDMKPGVVVRKRKQPDIFMKPKPKILRRS